MTAHDDVNNDTPEPESSESGATPAKTAEDAAKPEGWQQKVEQVREGAEKLKGLADKLRDKAA